MNIKHIIKYPISLILLFVISCNEEPVPTEYPRVKTTEVLNISKIGAMLNAQILNEGNKNIIEHGFVWREYWIRNGVLVLPRINNLDRRTTLTESIKTGNFSSSVSDKFEEGITYTVRAYVTNDEYLVYGNPVFFTTLQE